MAHRNASRRGVEMAPSQQSALLDLPTTWMPGATAPDLVNGS